MRVKDMLDMVEIDADPSFNRANKNVIMQKLWLGASKVLNEIRRVDKSYGMAYVDLTPDATTLRCQLPNNFGPIVTITYVDSAGTEGETYRLIDKRNAWNFLDLPYIAGKWLVIRSGSVSTVRVWYLPPQPPMVRGFVGSGCTESSIKFGDTEYGWLFAEDNYCLGAPLWVDNEIRMIKTYDTGTTTATVASDFSASASEGDVFEIGVMASPDFHSDIVDMTVAMINRDTKYIDYLVRDIRGRAGQSVQLPQDVLEADYDGW